MIRPAQASDRDALLDIWLEGNLTAHPFLPREYWEGMLPYVRRALPDAQVWVDVGITGEIRGFIGLTGTYVEGLFVAAGCRGEGVGTALLQAVSQSLSSLTLRVYVKNDRAIQFYLHRGFSLVSEERDPDTGEREYLMRLDKQPAAGKS